MRRGRFSLFLIILGVAAGLGMSLFYTWQVNPRVLTDIQPFQLSRQDKQAYLIALSMAFAKDHDALTAGKRLIELRLNWQDLANAACDLVQQGYAKTNTEITVIRSMVSLAGSQGKTGCASDFIPPNTPTLLPSVTFAHPTDTHVPPPSKTPSATLGVTFTPPPIEITATPAPTSDFKIDIVAVCNSNAVGIIEVEVQDSAGTGIPGVAIEINTANSDKDVFFTGLKPDRDNGFADFQMTNGETYTVALRDLGGRTRSLKAGECTLDGGGKGLASYRVVFRRINAK